jgi:repressor LexA
MLADRDRAALKFFREYAERYGRPPTVRQLGEGIGIFPPNNAQRVLARLVAAGELTEDQLPSGARSLRATPPRGIPFRGRVSCGQPVEMIDEDRGRLDLGDLLKGDDLVAYEATGRSMVEAGILPGDYLIVQECPDPDPGQVVIAMLDREMLCKKYKRTRKRSIIRLAPCNGEMPPIEVDTERGHFRILGVLRSVVRKV